MSTKQTAAEAYAENQRDIAAILDWIQTELEAHRERKEDQELTWDYVGDLGHVKVELKSILTFLSSVESDEIEQNLAELRM